MYLFRGLGHKTTTLIVCINLDKISDGFNSRCSEADNLRNFHLGLPPFRSFNSGYLYQVGIRPSLAALALGRMLPIPVAFATLGTVNGGLGRASLCLDLRAVHPPAPPGRRP